MNRQSKDIRRRTRRFALAIIKLVRGLPRDMVGTTIGRQVIRSATSVGANFVAAQRARSPAEFIAKLGISEEEADETIFWLDLLQESNYASPQQIMPLRDEAEQLLRIIAAIIISKKCTLNRT
ncbi:MAG: four helix bundle protein [Bacteroidota bacterium]